MAKVFIGIHTTGWISSHVTKWLLAQMTKAQGPGDPLSMEGIQIQIYEGKPEDAAANVIMEKFLESDCTHILKMDDDIMADLELIPRLLKHDKDIVGVPVTISQSAGITFCGCWIAEDGTWKSPDISPPNNKLIGPIDFVGGGCFLAKRKVIEELRKQGPIYVTEYQDGKIKMYCDNRLFQNIKKAGFQAWLDATQILGQITEVNLMQCINPGVYPRTTPGQS